MKGAAESPNYQTSNVRERYIEGGGGGYKKRNIGRGRRSLSSSGSI